MFAIIKKEEIVNLLAVQSSLILWRQQSCDLRSNEPLEFVEKLTKMFTRLKMDYGSAKWKHQAWRPFH